MISPRMRTFMVTLGILLALFLGTLGVETAPHNLLGWLLVLVAVGYLVGGAIYLWNDKRQDKVSRQEQGDTSFWLILPGFLAIFFAAPLEYLYLAAWLPRQFWMQGMGLVLILAAMLLRVWVRRTLKEMYTGHLQVGTEHRLVRQGPYRILRHPGYAGFVLMALGLAVGYSSLIGLLAIPVLLVPGLIYRMQVEERLLVEEFGEEYREYARKTKRLIPGVW